MNKDVEAMAKKVWDDLYNKGYILIPWEEASESYRQLTLNAVKDFYNKVR